MVTGISSATQSNTSRTAVGKSMDAMTPLDFLNLMITQLKNQDPFEPMTNSELLQQISSIRQLQSNMSLSDTLTGNSLREEIGSGGALIGKTVEGLNASGDRVSGVVTSVTIKDGSVLLDLDSGEQVPLGNLTRVLQTASAAAAATPALTQTANTNPLSPASQTSPATPDNNSTLTEN